MNNEKPRTFEPIKSKQVWTVLLFCLFGVFLSYHPIRCDFHYPPPSAIQPARQAEAAPSAAYSEVRSFPKSSEDPLFMSSSQKKAVVELESGVWSREIVTPATSKEYRIDIESSTDHYFVWFQDGTIARIGDKEAEIKDYGIRRGIFRILVEDSGQNQRVRVTAK